MGMYDYVKCERVLPGGLDGTGVSFQTKDFDCPFMDVYEITPDGRLVTDESHWETVPKAERPFPDAEEGSLNEVIGSIKRVVDKPNVDQNFHGVLNFYTLTDEGRWHEYNAKFMEGKLVSIEIVCEEIPDE